MKNKLADKIFIKKLAVPAIIGVFSEERQILQTLIINLEMTVDMMAAVQDDDLSKTVNYAEVVREVNDYISASSYQLLETLADGLATHLQHHFAISFVRLSITKQPRDLPDVERVGVIIERC